MIKWIPVLCAALLGGGVCHLTLEHGRADV
jgi:hypothetical protein